MNEKCEPDMRKTQLRKQIRALQTYDDAVHRDRSPALQESAVRQEVAKLLPLYRAAAGSVIHTRPGAGGEQVVERSISIKDNRGFTWRLSHTVHSSKHGPDYSVENGCLEVISPSLGPLWTSPPTAKELLNVTAVNSGKSSYIRHEYVVKSEDKRPIIGEVQNTRRALQRARKLIAEFGKIQTSGPSIGGNGGA